MEQNYKDRLDTPRASTAGDGKDGAPTGSIQSPPGFKKKVFGSVLFFIGGLNLVFSVKTGIEVDPFHIVVTILGSLIFLYGAIEGTKKPRP